MIDNNADVISQRSILGGPIFQFDKTHLVYSGDQWGFRIKYQNIAGPSRYLRTQSKDRIVSFIAGYLLILGFILLVYHYHGPRYGPAGFWTLLPLVGKFVALFVAVYGLLHFATHRKYTVIPTSSGNFWVAKGKQHDAIVRRIEAERRKALRLLSAPNPANAPNEELAKLAWLRQEGAIDEQEYVSLCARVSA